MNNVVMVISGFLNPSCLAVDLPVIVQVARFLTRRSKRGPCRTGPMGMSSLRMRGSEAPKS